MTDVLQKPLEYQKGVLVELIEKGCRDSDMRDHFVCSLDENKQDGAVYESGAVLGLSDYITHDTKCPVYEMKVTVTSGISLAISIINHNYYALPNNDDRYHWSDLIDHLRLYAAPDCPEED